MQLEEQIKVIFYSFIYGLFFLASYNFLNLIKFKNIFLKNLITFCFCMLHTLLFYFLLYKINGGILNYYIALFFILGIFFCHFLYFNDKNHWNYRKQII